MKKNKVLIDLAIFMYLFTAFFSFIFGNGYYMLIASFIPISLYAINAVVSMDKENYGWVVFMVFLWISAMVSIYTTISYKYLLVIGLSFLGKLIFESVYGWHLKFGKMVEFFATIHILGVILSYFFPDFINGIVEHFYTGDTIDTYAMLFEYNAYAGLTPQTGTAAFFTTIYIAFCISDMLNQKFNLWSIIKILLGFFALLLTVKRSFLVSNIIAIFFVFYIQNKGNRKFFRNALIFTITGVIAYYIFLNTTLMDTLIQKSDGLLESGDITNGRMFLWTETYKLWLEKPIFGHGVNVLPYYYGFSSHNSYLQILAEAGIFGFLSFIVAMFMSLVKSCSIYKEILRDTLLTDKEKTIFLASIYMQVIFIVYCFVGNPVHGMNFILPYLLFISCVKSFIRRKV